MPSHQDSLGAWSGRFFTKRANELAPPATDADILTAYPNDPCGFARDVLHISPWSKQGAILRSVVDHQRVAVVSGHKCGKSTALAILAIWFYCSFPGARVIITATTDRQVNGIIWREIKRLLRASAIRIPGADECSVRAASGLTDPNDFSEIRGYTAKEAEAIAGTSGAYILYLVDEASGVLPVIFEAIQGNRAAGNAWVFLISNPTRADGEFYEAFHEKSKGTADDPGPMPAAGYHNIRIDSRDSPNITGEWQELEEWDEKAGGWRARRGPIPGLAVDSWIQERIEEWGEDSAQFKIRVAGLFSVAEAAKIFSAGMLLESQQRWVDADAAGRLYIGVDPAGEGDQGDEFVLCPRSGAKVHGFTYLTAGLRTPAGCLDAIHDLIDKHRKPGSPLPVVSIDAEGAEGWKIYVPLKEAALRTKRFMVSRVRAGERAIRQPHIYDKIRDELYANAREWMRAGGGIPESPKLEKELHTPEYASDIRGRLKLTPKKDLRKLLGRSPDTAEAFTLACWEPLAARQEDAAGTSTSTRATPHDGYEERGGAMNPYGAADAFMR